MFAVRINRANYEYDVNALVRAFWPGEQVAVLTPEMKEEKRAQLEPSVRMTVTLTEEGAEITVSGLAGLSGTESGAADQTGSRRFVWRYDREEVFRDAGQTAESGELPLTYKEEFKRFLYRTLCEVTGRTLPWGNLTGIRPTKIAYGMLEEGKTGEEIRELYRRRHYVSEEKALLAVSIAARERELLRSVHYEGGYSLYIGIPFCPTTCLYCSFTSYPISVYRKRVDEYVDCLLRELAYVSDCQAHKILDTVYIGGGTPTTLEPEQLDRLIGGLRKLFDFTTVQEFTVEAGRADSITRDKLEVLRRHGVTRISVNPQTMRQNTLDLIGRKATVEQVEAAFALARREGFTNINMDLILGLPGELEEDVQYTVNRVAALAPDSLTVHSLAIKRASRLNEWIRQNETPLLHNTDETMRIAAQGAAGLGMEPYYLYRQKNMSGNFENVGYARPGKEGLYNILIMEEKQTIVACGAGSISKRVYPDGRIERSENVKEVALYMEKIGEMIERKRQLLGTEVG